MSNPVCPPEFPPTEWKGAGRWPVEWAVYLWAPPAFNPDGSIRIPARWLHRGIHRRSAHALVTQAQLREGRPDDHVIVVRETNSHEVIA